MSVDVAWIQAQFPTISGLTQIGRGAQKWVFAGTHPADGDVVLKLFNPNAVEDRATREVQAVENIHSPRIPKVYEIGKVQGPLGEMIWLREQRIHADNLRRRLQTGPLGPTAVLRLGLHMLEALSAAEQARIVHRDVKPENIIMGGDGCFWLLDFGLARLLDETSLTATGAAFGVGTPGYAPPEQFRNRKDDIDGRSDLFALGVTLYEATEGVNPYWNGTHDVGEVIRRVETMPLPPITKDIEPSGAFRDMVLAMTRIRQDHRPSNAAEAFTWIQEICAAQGVP
jgi:serine/threonine protein kinase